MNNISPPTKIKFEAVYRLALEAAHEDHRLPLLHRDSDILGYVTWAIDILEDDGSPLVVDDVRRGLTELVDDVFAFGSMLTSKEKHDLSDLGELRHLLEVTSQGAWVIFITSILNRVRGISPPLTEYRPTESPREVEDPSKPRCDPKAPTAGAIDHDDPEQAPPHGTCARYRSSRYMCRCDLCRQANTDYCRKARRAKKERHKDCITNARDEHTKYQSSVSQSAADKPHHNAKCWCGSERKYKRCHLMADLTKGDEACEDGLQVSC